MQIVSMGDKDFLIPKSTNTFLHDNFMNTVKPVLSSHPWEA